MSEQIWNMRPDKNGGLIYCCLQWPDLRYFRVHVHTFELAERIQLGQFDFRSYFIAPWAHYRLGPDKVDWSIGRGSHRKVTGTFSIFYEDVHRNVLVLLSLFSEQNCEKTVLFLYIFLLQNQCTSIVTYYYLPLLVSTLLWRNLWRVFVKWHHVLPNLCYLRVHCHINLIAHIISNPQRQKCAKQ